MHFLKTFGLLLLLTLGNTGFAFSYHEPLPNLQVDQEDYQFSEDHQNLFESTLVNLSEVQTNSIFIPVALVPDYLCPRKVSRANRYFVFSQTIIPSRDISAIIFPFHTFL